MRPSQEDEEVDPEPDPNVEAGVPSTRTDAVPSSDKRPRERSADRVGDRSSIRWNARAGSESRRGESEGAVPGSRVACDSTYVERFFARVFDRDGRGVPSARVPVVTTESWCAAAPSARGGERDIR